MRRPSGEMEFHPKTPEELASQVREVDDALIDQPISPPSEREAVLSMSAEQLKEKFPRRYQIYLDLLRDKHSPQTSGEYELERMSKWLYILNSLDNYITHHNQAETKDQTLWEKQLTVFEDLRNFLEQGGLEGYIKLPTGTGKTVIFAELIESLGLRTLIVVPKKILIEQTKATLSKFTEGLDVGRVYSDAREQGRQVTITTYQSLNGAIKRGAFKHDDFDLIILDEVHKALSSERMGAVHKFQDAIKIGFTATHKFSEKKQVSQLLAKEIHNMGINEAVKEGMLSSYKVMFVETATDITNVPVMTTGDYNPEKLEEAINVDSRNQSAVEIYSKMFDRQKAIAYCQGVQHAMDLAQTFRDSGISAAAIHGGHRIKEQMALKQQFQKGEIMILCNADILTEGFDEPSAAVCLNLRPTLSRVVAEQRGGRILRLDPNDPNKEAVIVDFIDKTRSRNKMPITFAEVSGAAFVSNKNQPPIVRENPDFGSSVKVITDPVKVKAYTERMIREKKQEAPMGWVPISGLIKANFVRAIVLESVINKYRETHPEWIGTYLDYGKTYREFYSPELAKLVEAEVTAKVDAPTGWKTLLSLHRELKRGLGPLSKAANRLGYDHPEWFKKYYSLDREIRIPEEHLAPELADKIRELFRFERYPVIPDPRKKRKEKSEEEE